MKAIVLAAGEGKRLRPFTELLPKPLIPFIGKPLFTYSLDYLKDLGINHILINTFHLKKIFINQVEMLFKQASYKHFNYQIKTEPFLLGMGGTVLNFKSELQTEEDFLILNSDEILLFKSSNTLNKFVEHHKKSKALATLLVIDHPLVGDQFGGAWCNEKNQVQLFSKKTPEKKLKGYHFVGILICNQRIFKFLDEPLKEINLLYETLTRAISQNEIINVYPVDAHWFETGNPADFINATKDVLNLIEKQNHLSQKDQSAWYQPFTSVIKNQKPRFMIEDEALKEKILILY